MGLDIYSKKSDLSFSIGYSGFMFLRNSLIDCVFPGFGALHWWAVHTNHGSMPFLKEKGWNEKTERLEYEISNVTKATPKQFGLCCDKVLYAWFKVNKMTAFWDLLICHSDCGGKLTPKQCSRLIKDLDKIKVDDSAPWKKQYLKFYNLLKEAANRNETLIFS